MRKSRKRGGKGGETFAAVVSNADDIARAKREYEDHLMTKADDAAFAQGQENIEAYLAEQ